MNEKDIVETSKDNNEDISSSKVSDVEEKKKKIRKKFRHLNPKSKSRRKIIQNLLNRFNISINV